MSTFFKSLTQRHRDTERKWISPLFSVALCLCVIFLPACGRKITDSNLRVLKPEMTTKEVESILGAPTHVETGPELISKEVKTLPVTHYIYEQNGKKVELLFVGDRLSSSLSGTSVNTASTSGTTISSGKAASSPKVPMIKNETPAITGSFGN